MGIAESNRGTYFYFEIERPNTSGLELPQLEQNVKRL